MSETQVIWLASIVVSLWGIEFELTRIRKAIEALKK